MEGDGGDVERCLEHLVVKVIVGATLTHVGAHTDGVQYEVYLAEGLDGFLEDYFEFLLLGRIGRDDLCAELFT